jgi:hypothetical protein
LTRTLQACNCDCKKGANAAAQGLVGNLEIQNIPVSQMTIGSKSNACASAILSSEAGFRMATNKSARLLLGEFLDKTCAMWVR